MSRHVVSREYICSLCFMPRLNDEFRRLFREKRLELGLTYSRLSAYFLVNWSTIRKWEVGESRNCNSRVRPLLVRFLSGDADQELGVKLWPKLPGGLPQGLPRLARNCLNSYLQTYQDCEGYPDLRREMLQIITGATTILVNRLLSTRPEDFDKSFSVNQSSVKKP